MAEERKGELSEREWKAITRELEARKNYMVNDAVVLYKINKFTRKDIMDIYERILKHF